MNVKNIKSLWFIAIILLFLTACSKEEKQENWSNCYNCNLDSWTGSWTGKASVFNAQNNSTTEGLDVNVGIAETGTNYLTFSLIIPNQYSSTISGELLAAYSVSFAGSNNSITATIFEKEGEYKLTGTAKKFHYKVDELVIETVVTFEVTRD